MQGDVRHARRSTPCRRKSRAEQVHTRRLVLTVCLLALMVVITAAVSYSSRAEATPDTASTAPNKTTATTVDPAASLVSAIYTAEMVVSGSSPGSGEPKALLTIEYNSIAQTLSYKLQVTSPLNTPCVAAIYQGSPGLSGSTVYAMFPGPAIAGNFSGILAEGIIAADDLVGPLMGGKLTDLVLLLKSGEAYAAIGTASNPVDAIRGQIN
jgi:hypothetical protein